MDEEHDISYKQDNPMPCYDARDVAIERVKGSYKITLERYSFYEDLEKSFFEKKFKLVRMEKE